ncbi:hypothetical protein KPH14_011341 [Odynerus spinipes]|uniref:Uncharacterized protein n=1 Tax=Odynerus spinipes TaxID=1348599 RepID=A0AAD9VN35_9HYME|nr:hypothetical protein KPH14_011341 [Odynerus spinipes]
MLKIRMLDYIGDTGRQQLDQSVYCESESRRSTVEDERQDVHGTNQDKIKGTTTQDLFELLERVQSSRLDDQRCVLPPYFSQVSTYIEFLYST